jgi:hypothetical protein
VGFPLGLSDGFIVGFIVGLNDGFGVTLNVGFTVAEFLRVGFNLPHYCDFRLQKIKQIFEISSN